MATAPVGAASICRLYYLLWYRDTAFGPTWHLTAGFVAFAAMFGRVADFIQLLLNGLVPSNTCHAARYGLVSGGLFSGCAAFGLPLAPLTLLLPVSPLDIYFLCPLHNGIQMDGADALSAARQRLFL